MMLLHLQVGLNLYLIPKRASRELEAPASFQRWTSYSAPISTDAKPLDSNMVEIYRVHPDTPQLLDH